MVEFRSYFSSLGNYFFLAHIYNSGSSWAAIMTCDSKKYDNYILATT